MGSIKKAVEQSIESLKELSDNPMAARNYPIEQIIDMLNAVLTAGEDTNVHTGSIKLSEDMLEDLIEVLKHDIESSVSGISNDAIDFSTIEMRISGDSAQLEDISLDTDYIADEVTCNIEDVVNDWAKKYKLIKY